MGFMGSVFTTTGLEANVCLKNRLSMFWHTRNWICHFAFLGQINHGLEHGMARKQTFSWSKIMGQSRIGRSISTVYCLRFKTDVILHKKGSLFSLFMIRDTCKNVARCYDIG